MRLEQGRQRNIFLYWYYFWDTSGFENRWVNCGELQNINYLMRTREISVPDYKRRDSEGGLQVYFLLSTWKKTFSDEQQCWTGYSAVNVNIRPVLLTKKQREEEGRADMGNNKRKWAQTVLQPNPLSPPFFHKFHRLCKERRSFCKYYF